MTLLRTHLVATKNIGSMETISLNVPNMNQRDRWEKKKSVYTERARLQKDLSKNINLILLLQSSDENNSVRG